MSPRQMVFGPQGKTIPADPVEIYEVRAPIGRLRLYGYDKSWLTLVDAQYDDCEASAAEFLNLPLNVEDRIDERHPLGLFCHCGRV